jgi:phosphosulfolactate phosphohydrolase-like enzyme
MAVKKTVVIDSFADAAFRHLERDAIVCVDVMQASTTLVTAVAQGRPAFVAASPEDAVRLAEGLERPLLAGTDDGRVTRFEMPDSPAALARHEDRQRPLVLCSPPGTDMITNASSSAAGSPEVLVASFRNLTATVNHIVRHHRRVAVLAAGHHDELSCEDVMAAARIVQMLLQRGFEAADLRTGELTRRWGPIEVALAGWGNGAARLRTAGQAQDVEFVLGHVDDVPLACVCRSGEVSSADAAGAADRSRRLDPTAGARVAGLFGGGTPEP